ncbi:hypothetical protein DDE82_004619 [Stemphylium lycopersici]|uniref:Uncharacterized protein n=1 Tax=Stemphylium lycopersici TaxID=183478 RepID=A0A364N323_STELY|nr:hypothetical protein TW65_02926 [Stemphylium lycopersici]RAR04414.1 hypothetical protein DDE82_004619 [Stemphylium lycopersici]RAR10751.1 hypothetical protein DDE83_004895 [Stemphylium lycopersici]
MTTPYSQSSARSSMATQLPIIPPRQAPARPKLSINTEQPRILGKGASLRLETLSAVSPTVRNTYSNAYERPSTAPALQRPQRPQLSIESDFAASSTNVSTNSASTPSSASTLSSTLTSASNESASSAIPYKQPHNLASILSNSPARSIIPRKMGSNRPMFPAEKRVSFRTPLEEEITTTKYIMAHSDLDSSISTLSTISSSASSTSTSTDSDVSASQDSLAVNTSNAASQASISPLSLSLEKCSSTCSSVQSSPRPKNPRIGDKRDSSSSEDDSDSCPETPVAGRRKRTRDWRWTLGPLPSSSSDKSTSSASDITTSEDSS